MDLITFCESIFLSPNFKTNHSVNYQQVMWQTM